MKDFKDVIEKWATIYKPMQHTPGKTGRNKRFFLFENIVSIPNFMNTVPNGASPCVGYEFSQEGRIKGGLIMPTHVIYFMVRAANNIPTDKEASYEAQREAVMHMQKFLAWLKKEQETDKDLANINIETEEIHYSTYGPFFNNWYAVFIELTDTRKFPFFCVSEEDYIHPEDAPEQE